MSYARIAATAEAKRYIEQSEAKERAEQRRGAPGARMMNCGLTCQQWLDTYLKRNLPAAVAEHNTETNHDDQDRREATGTEARPISAGEGVGDPPGEQAQGEASGGADWIEQAIGTSSVVERNDPRLSADTGGRLDDPGNEASWIDEAWPEGSQGADFTEADRTPF